MLKKISKRPFIISAIKWVARFSFLLGFAVIIPFVFSSSSHGNRGMSAVDQPVKASAERRIALVIGNSDYKRSPLRNPVNDAEDISAMLKRLGFEVSLKKNMTRKEMRRAIRDFGNDLKRGGVGLFYYAGHGMQVGGRNYLIPIGADINAEDEVQDEAVDAGLVLRKMEFAGNAMNMVFLDACRDNPMARSFRSTATGLARMDAPTGSLLVYATAPGDVSADGEGRNGIFTEKLLAHMDTPNLEIGQMLRKVRVAVKNETNGKQIPWEYSSLEGNFYFVPDLPSGEEPLPEPPPPITLLGHLQVNVNTKASVKVNGELQGTADPESPLNLQNLSAGTVTVHVEAKGYEPQERRVSIKRNQWTQELFTLQWNQVTSLTPPSPPLENPLIRNIPESDPATPDREAISFDRTQKIFVDDIERMIGWQFKVGPSPIRIKMLGVFDAGRDGLEAPHKVGIWTEKGKLVLSEEVPSGTVAPMKGNFRYSRVPATSLKANSTYIIAAKWPANADGLVIDSYLDKLPGHEVERFAVDGAVTLGKKGLARFKKDATDFGFPKKTSDDTVRALIGPNFIFDMADTYQKELIAGDQTYRVSGKFSTTFGELTFHPSGITVGEYPLHKGRLLGSYSGYLFTGNWVEPSSNRKCSTQKEGTHYWGTVRFTFNLKYSEFFGVWGYCDDEPRRNWNGKRIDQKPSQLRESSKQKPTQDLTPYLMEEDVDRPGSDFKNFALSSAAPFLCQKACINEGGCKAWTYVKPGIQGNQARCWLKNRVPSPMKNTCCVSGVKGDQGNRVVSGLLGEWVCLDKNKWVLLVFPSQHEAIFDDETLSIAISSDTIRVESGSDHGSYPYHLQGDILTLTNPENKAIVQCERKESDIFD